MKRPSDEASPEPWEVPFLEASRLLRAGEFDNACLCLRQARLHAIEEGDRDNAAFYSNVLGSFLSSRHRDAEALAMYSEAESLEPTNLNYKLATARHLVVMHREEEAAAKLEQVDISALTGKSILHGFHGISGLAAAAAGNIKEATESLKRAFAPEVIESLTSEGFDLTLLSELIEKGVAPREGNDYLEIIYRRAEQEGNRRMSAVVKKLRRKLG